jgi:hypothetical protein
MTNNALTTTTGSNLPANINDRLARLRQQAAQTGEVWQPQPGDCLAGVLIGWTKAHGAYGEGYQILIQDENGTVTAAWLTSWLKDNLRAQGADRGDLVAITFLGKKLSPAGRPYNAYSLVVDKLSAP